jgi:hypothetical protein
MDDDDDASAATAAAADDTPPPPPPLPWRAELFPFTESEFRTALAVTRALAADPDGLYKQKEIRPFREALQPLFNLQKAAMFNGNGDAETNAVKQMLKRRKAIERDKQKAEDKAFLERTRLRAGRLTRLDHLAKQEALEGEGLGHVQLLIDGVADDGTAINAVVLPTDNRKRLLEEAEIVGDDADPAADAAADAAAAANDAADGNADGDPPAAATAASEPEAGARPTLLNNAIACYSCHRRFREVHHFYDKLCPPCAALNFEKRVQTCDMRGRICLVTGGRVKIGFQCCMKLLRCGATVLATSRFPVDTASRFAEQADYAEWCGRLHVFGLDFRNIPALETFCDMLLQVRRTPSLL